MCAFFLSRAGQALPTAEAQRQARERAMQEAQAHAIARRGPMATAGATSAADRRAAAVEKVAASLNTAEGSGGEDCEHRGAVDIMARVSTQSGPFRPPRVFNDSTFGPIEIHFGCLPDGDTELSEEDEQPPVLSGPAKRSSASVDIMAKVSTENGPFKPPRVLNDPEFGPIEIHFGCLPTGETELPSDDERESEDEGDSNPIYVNSSGVVNPTSRSDTESTKTQQSSGQSAGLGLRISDTSVTHFRMNVTKTASLSSNTSLPILSNLTAPPRPSAAGASAKSVASARPGLVTTAGHVGSRHLIRGINNGSTSDRGAFGPTKMHGSKILKASFPAQSRVQFVDASDAGADTTRVVSTGTTTGFAAGVGVAVSSLAVPAAVNPHAKMQGEVHVGIVKGEDKPRWRQTFPAPSLPTNGENKAGAESVDVDADGTKARVFAPVQTLAEEMARMHELRMNDPDLASKIMSRGSVLVDLCEKRGDDAIVQFNKFVTKCRPGEFLQWHVCRALRAAGCAGHEKVFRLLCAHGAPLKDQNGKSLGMLPACCEAGADISSGVIRYLVSERGEDVDECKAPDFTTPLHDACMRLDVETASLLVELGAGVNAVAADDSVPLGIVLKRAKQAAPPPMVQLTRSGVHQGMSGMPMGGAPPQMAAASRAARERAKKIEAILRKNGARATWRRG